MSGNDPWGPSGYPGLGEAWDSDNPEETLDYLMGGWRHPISIERRKIMIRNLTPHAVTLLREDPDGEIVGYVGYGPKAQVHRFAVVETLPSEGVARAAQTVRRVATLGAPPAPITVAEFGAPEGLPDQEPWTWLIVSEKTAIAAREHGRQVGDLLLVGETVRDEKGVIVGCVSYGTLAPESWTGGG